MNTDENHIEELYKIKDVFEAEGSHATFVNITLSIGSREAKSLNRYLAIAELAGLPNELALRWCLCEGMQLREKRVGFQGMIQETVGKFMSKMLGLKSDAMEENIEPYDRLYHFFEEIKDSTDSVDGREY